MTNIFEYGDIVSYKNGSGEFCILCTPPTAGNFSSRKDYLAVDLVTNEIIFLDEHESVKIGEIEEGANPCPPIFDPSMPLLSRVSLVGSSLTGTLVAVNPILFPLNFECEYLIVLEQGGSIVAKSSELIVLNNM